MKNIRKQIRIHFCEVDVLVNKFISVNKHYPKELIIGLLPSLEYIKIISLDLFRQLEPNRVKVK